MKRTLLIVIVLVSLLSLTGCVSAKTGYSDSGVTTSLVPKEYEVLGEISFDGTVTNILGLFTFGGKGYEELLQKAKGRYPGADAVIDIYKDYRASSLLGVYNTWRYSYYGTVIKYK